MTQTHTLPAERQRLLMRMFLASVLVLLLAQGLNGVLTASALRSASTQALETAVRLVGHDRAFHIGNALRLGKPLTQLYGLGEMLDGLARDLPFVDMIAVTLPAGEVVDYRSTDGTGSHTAAPPRTKVEAARAGEAPRRMRITISGRGDSIAGYLLFSLPDAAIDDALAPTRAANIETLIASSAIGLLVLMVSVLVFRRLPEQHYRRGLFIAPFVALLIAQGLYSWHNVDSFREGYLEGVRSNVQRATDRLGEEFDRLLGLGVGIERLHRAETPFQRILDDIPELESLRLVTADGRTVFALGADTERLAARSLAVGTALHGPGGDDPETPTVVGRIEARLSGEALSRGVRQRMLDAGTVVVASAIFVLELLLLLTALMRANEVRIAAPQGATTARPLLARTAAFCLLFAWALPLSFVPLHMATLYEPVTGLSKDFVLALPVSAEMALALVATLLAGRLADRHGWHIPFLTGTLLCVAGAAASALAGDSVSFIAARALVGLGYGLAWMGIQSHVFTASPRGSHTQAIASLVAGIFAGHLCGSATGGMLADQFGHQSVFMLAALAGLVPFVFALGLMRAHFVRPTRRTESIHGATGLRTLLADRNYSALLALCVIPFSIVQVGLLYFALPVHLGNLGNSSSDIGRILMVYGLSVIYLGPLLGRWLGRYPRRKPFIVLAGLIGGAGLAWLQVDAGITALLAAVFLLGVVSSFGGPAQSSFALALPVVERVGTGEAMAINRTADKLGQMLGPLAIGAMFAMFGSQSGLALTGVIYMLCAVGFLFLAREAGVGRPETTRSA